MSKKAKPLYGIGGVTLLTVLLVLCLTLFSVLALSSAQADFRLSEKNAKSITDYYTVENRANEFMRAAGELWPDGQARPLSFSYINSLNELYDDEDYAIWAYEEGDGLIVSADIQLETGSVLKVEFFLKPGNDSSRYEILQWQVEPPSIDEGGIAFLPLFLP